MRQYMVLRSIRQLRAASTRTERQWLRPLSTAPRNDSLGGGAVVDLLETSDEGDLSDHVVC
jgi:hypothetical protein